MPEIHDKWMQYPMLDWIFFFLVNITGANAKAWDNDTLGYGSLKPALWKTPADFAMISQNLH